MSEVLPEPLVPPEVDCTDLDGFMLNAERLMASELVALSSHEAVAAALFLWCRAWKQRPAASLPDDERVLAAFARLPLSRFRKIREQAMRGFVKCSDGRLYHRVVAEEAVKAYGFKAASRRKREADAERLRKWRASQAGTPDETQSETRVVAEGQDRTGQDRTNKKEPKGAPQGAGQAGASPDLSDPSVQLYARGKAVLGKGAGGLIKRLVEHHGGNVALARADLERASTRADARDYIGAILAKRPVADDEPKSRWAI